MWGEYDYPHFHADSQDNAKLKGQYTPYHTGEKSAYLGRRVGKHSIVQLYNIVTIGK